MAISWGAWSGTSRQIRLGIEVDWSGPVNHGWETVKATVSYWVDVRNGSFSDEQTLHFGGWIDGTYTKVNYQSGADGPKKWETRTKLYTYGSCEYGSSPGSRTFNVWMTGAGGGNINPDHSVTRNIPSRPYDSPLAPTNVSSSRISDTSIKTTWTNRDTCGEPWDNLRVQYDSAANDVWNGDVGVPGGGATSFTFNDAVANNAYRFRVRSENNVGNSAYVEGDLIYTTPAAPTNAVRTGNNGENQTISWTNNTSEYINHLVEVERSADGGAWTTVLASGARDLTSWVDTYPASNPATKFKYRVRTKTNGGVQGTLYSAYSNETTETTGVSTPPSAPTNLSPTNNTLINPTQARSFTWQHNSTDNSDQSGYQVQWRVVGGAWTVRSKVTSTASSWSAPASTFPDNSDIEWQVRTWGVASTGGSDGTGASPWSATAKFETVGDPNVRREQVRVMRLDLETGRQETAPVGVLPPIGSITMFGGTSAPQGWLLCHGQSLLRADYPDLFGVIGTAFGAVDSTHFSLPNVSERFPLGTTSAQAPGAQGGNSKIAIANLPAHAHGPGTLSTNDPGNHSHGVQRRLSTGTGTGNAQGGGSLSPDGNNISTSDGSHTHTVNAGTTGATGSGEDYWPRYLRLNYIIKT